MAYRDSVFWTNDDGPTALLGSIQNELAYLKEAFMYYDLDEEDFLPVLAKAFVKIDAPDSYGIWQTLEGNLSNLQDTLEDAINEFSENMTDLLSYEDPDTGEPTPVLREAFIEIIDDKARGAIDVLKKGLIDENPSGDEYALIYLVARRAIQVILNKESEIQEVTLESSTT